jgi:putative transcriptional regulator
MENVLESSSEKKTTPGYLTGKILLATPFMTDNRFTQSVVYVCGHDENGAMGFILNKPLPSVHLQDLFNQLKIEHTQNIDALNIFYGGPIEIGRGFVLHSPDYMSQTTVRITNKFSITATLEILKLIGSNLGPQKFLLLMGYSGWAAGQLENEVNDNHWIIINEGEDLVYDMDPLHKWEHAYKALKIDPTFFLQESGHA